MAEGTKDDPWVLRTPPGTSEYTMYRDETRDPPALVCQVGKSQLAYDLRCIDDLHAMLKSSTATGSRSAAPTSRSRPRRTPSRPGDARSPTRSAAGTG